MTAADLRPGHVLMRFGEGYRVTGFSSNARPGRIGVWAGGHHHILDVDEPVTLGRVPTAGPIR